MIINSGSTISRDDVVRQRQLAIRRELDRRNIALKVIAYDSGIPYSTLLSYFPEPGSKEPAQMPTGVLFALCGHVPDDLLSLMLPDGRQIVRAPEEIDHDEVCQVVEDYLAAKMQAHRVDSPGGPQIVDCEDNVLRGKFARVKAA